MDNEQMIVGKRSEIRIDDNYPAPEKPHTFNKKLEQDFGLLNGFPRYRVAWGQSEKTWRSGSPKLKYVYAIFREDRLHGVDVFNWKNSGQVKRLNFKQAEKYTPTKGEIIVPNVEHYEKEIGDPFYWLEFYSPPSFYGTEDEWNSRRWLVEDDGHRIDLTGPYPEKGRYEPLLRLSNIAPDGAEEYRPLNDNTYDWIRSMLQGDKQKMEQALNEQRMKLDFQLEEAFDDPDINHEVEEILKKRHSIIVG